MSCYFILRFFQMSIRRICARKNLQALTAFPEMSNPGNSICRERKILLRDRELKDNIMAVQRRIPRCIQWAMPFLVHLSNFRTSTSIMFSICMCLLVYVQVVAGKWAEHGSVLVHGRKKENNLLNGNHLLNFHYEPRDAQRRSVGKSTRRYSYNSNRWLPSVQKHKYNKEQFIQAR